MSRRDRTDVPGEIVTVDDAFARRDLDRMRRLVEAAGDGGHPFNALTSFTNGKTIDPAMSSLLYDGLRPHMPSLYRDRRGVRWEPVGASAYVMYADIAAGQQFGVHTDTGVVWDEGGGLVSKFTAFVVLGGDFRGGDTVFYDEGYRRLCDVEHAEGRALLFDIDLPHAGATVTEGRKTWVGTEVVCRRIG